MIVSDDGMLAAEAERAMTFHIDGVRRFAFFRREDHLDCSNELITGRSTLSPTANFASMGNPPIRRLGALGCSQCVRSAIDVINIFTNAA
jgi:hypothetical protein